MEFGAEERDHLAHTQFALPSSIQIFVYKHVTACYTRFQPPSRRRHAMMITGIKGLTRPRQKKPLNHSRNLEQHKSEKYFRSNKFKFEQRKFATQVKWGASCVCVWKIRWMDVKNTQRRKQKLKFLLRSFNFPKRWSPRTSGEDDNHELFKATQLTHPQVRCDDESSRINKYKCNRKALFRFTWQRRLLMLLLLVRRSKSEKEKAKCNKFPHIFRLIWMFAARCAHTVASRMANRTKSAQCLLLAHIR